MSYPSLSLRLSLISPVLCFFTASVCIIHIISLSKAIFKWSYVSVLQQQSVKCSTSFIVVYDSHWSVCEEKYQNTPYHTHPSAAQQHSRCNAFFHFRRITSDHFLQPTSIGMIERKCKNTHYPCKCCTAGATFFFFSTNHITIFSNQRVRSNNKLRIAAAVDIFFFFLPLYRGHNSCEKRTTAAPSTTSRTAFRWSSTP